MLGAPRSAPNHCSWAPEAHRAPPAQGQGRGSAGRILVGGELSGDVDGTIVPYARSRTDSCCALAGRLTGVCTPVCMAHGGHADSSHG
jgi:hypothetical protein